MGDLFIAALIGIIIGVIIGIPWGFAISNMNFEEPEEFKKNDFD